MEDAWLEVLWPGLQESSPQAPGPGRGEKGGLWSPERGLKFAGWAGELSPMDTGAIRVERGERPVASSTAESWRGLGTDSPGWELGLGPGGMGTKQGAGAAPGWVEQVPEHHTDTWVLLPPGWCTKLAAIIKEPRPGSAGCQRLWLRARCLENPCTHAQRPLRADVAWNFRS